MFDEFSEQLGRRLRKAKAKPRPKQELTIRCTTPDTRSDQTSLLSESSDMSRQSELLPRSQPELIPRHRSSSSSSEDQNVRRRVEVRVEDRRWEVEAVPGWEQWADSRLFCQVIPG